MSDLHDKRRGYYWFDGHDGAMCVLLVTRGNCTCDELSGHEHLHIFSAGSHGIMSNHSFMYLEAKHV